MIARLTRIAAATALLLIIALTTAASAACHTGVVELTGATGRLCFEDVESVVVRDSSVVSVVFNEGVAAGASVLFENVRIGYYVHIDGTVHGRSTVNFTSVTFTGESYRKPRFTILRTGQDVNITLDSVEMNLRTAFLAGGSDGSESYVTRPWYSLVNITGIGAAVASGVTGAPHIRIINATMKLEDGVIVNTTYDFAAVYLRGGYLNISGPPYHDPPHVVIENARLSLEKKRHFEAKQSIVGFDVRLAATDEDDADPTGTVEVRGPMEATITAASDDVALFRGYAQKINFTAAGGAHEVALRSSAKSGATLGGIATGIDVLRSSRALTTAASLRSGDTAQRRPSQVFYSADPRYAAVSALGATFDHDDAGTVASKSVWSLGGAGGYMLNIAGAPGHVFLRYVEAKVGHPEGDRLISSSFGFVKITSDSAVATGSSILLHNVTLKNAQRTSPLRSGCEGLLYLTTPTSSVVSQGALLLATGLRDTGLKVSLHDVAVNVVASAAASQHNAWKLVAHVWRHPDLHMEVTGVSVTASCLRVMGTKPFYTYAFEQDVWNYTVVERDVSLSFSSKTANFAYAKLRSVNDKGGSFTSTEATLEVERVSSVTAASTLDVFWILGGSDGTTDVSLSIAVWTLTYVAKDRGFRVLRGPSGNFVNSSLTVKDSTVKVTLQDRPNVAALVHLQGNEADGLEVTVTGSNVTVSMENDPMTSLFNGLLVTAQKDIRRTTVVVSNTTITHTAEHIDVMALVYAKRYSSSLNVTLDSGTSVSLEADKDESSLGAVSTVSAAVFVRGRYLEAARAGAGSTTTGTAGKAEEADATHFTSLSVHGHSKFAALVGSGQASLLYAPSMTMPRLTVDIAGRSEVSVTTRTAAETVHVLSTELGSPRTALVDLRQGCAISCSLSVRGASAVTVDGGDGQETFGVAIGQSTFVDDTKTTTGDVTVALVEQSSLAVSANLSTAVSNAQKTNVYGIAIDTSNKTGAVVVHVAPWAIDEQRRRDGDMRREIQGGTPAPPSSATSVGSGGGDWSWSASKPAFVFSVKRRKLTDYGGTALDSHGLVTGVRISRGASHSGNSLGSDSAVTMVGGRNNSGTSNGLAGMLGSDTCLASSSAAMAASSAFEHKSCGFLDNTGSFSDHVSHYVCSDESDNRGTIDVENAVGPAAVFTTTAPLVGATVRFQKLTTVVRATSMPQSTDASGLVFVAPAESGSGVETTAISTGTVVVIADIEAQIFANTNAHSGSSVTVCYGLCVPASGVGSVRRTVGNASVLALRYTVKVGSSGFNNARTHFISVTDIQDDVTVGVCHGDTSWSTSPATSGGDPTALVLVQTAGTPSPRSGVTVDISNVTFTAKNTAGEAHVVAFKNTKLLSPMIQIRTATVKLTPSVVSATAASLFLCDESVEGTDLELTVDDTEAELTTTTASAEIAVLKLQANTIMALGGTLNVSDSKITVRAPAKAFLAAVDNNAERAPTMRFTNVEYTVPTVIGGHVVKANMLHVDMAFYNCTLSVTATSDLVLFDSRRLDVSFDLTIHDSDITAYAKAAYVWGAAITAPKRAHVDVARTDVTMQGGYTSTLFLLVQAGGRATYGVHGIALSCNSSSVALLPAAGKTSIAFTQGRPGNNQNYIHNFTGTYEDTTIFLQTDKTTGAPGGVQQAGLLLLADTAHFLVLGVMARNVTALSVYPGDYKTMRAAADTARGHQSFEQYNTDTTGLFVPGASRATFPLVLDSTVLRTGTLFEGLRSGTRNTHVALVLGLGKNAYRFVSNYSRVAFVNVTFGVDMVFGGAYVLYTEGEWANDGAVDETPPSLSSSEAMKVKYHTALSSGRSKVAIIDSTIVLRTGHDGSNPASVVGCPAAVCFGDGSVLSAQTSIYMSGWVLHHELGKRTEVATSRQYRSALYVWRSIAGSVYLESSSLYVFSHAVEAGNDMMRIRGAAFALPTHTGGSIFVSQVSVNLQCVNTPMACNMFVLKGGSGTVDVQHVKYLRRSLPQLPTSDTGAYSVVKTDDFGLNPSIRSTGPAALIDEEFEDTSGLSSSHFRSGRVTVAHASVYLQLKHSSSRFQNLYRHAKAIASGVTISVRHCQVLLSGPPDSTNLPPSSAALVYLGNTDGATTINLIAERNRGRGEFYSMIDSAAESPSTIDLTAKYNTFDSPNHNFALMKASRTDATYTRFSAFLQCNTATGAVTTRMPSKATLSIWQCDQLDPITRTLSNSTTVSVTTTPTRSRSQGANAGSGSMSMTLQQSVSGTVSVTSPLTTTPSTALSTSRSPTASMQSTLSVSPSALPSPTDTRRASASATTAVTATATSVSTATVSPTQPPIPTATVVSVTRSVLSSRSPGAVSVSTSNATATSSASSTVSAAVSGSSTASDNAPRSLSVTPTHAASPTLLSGTLANVTTTVTVTLSDSDRRQRDHYGRHFVSQSTTPSATVNSTMTATPHHPPVGTPQPQVVRVAETSVSVASTVSAVITSPVTAVQASRSLMLLRLPMCAVELDEPLDRFNSPTGVAISDDPARYFLGAAVMNTAIIVGLHLLSAAAGAGCRFLSIMSDQRLFPEASKSWAHAMAAGRFPGLPFIGVLLLLQPVIEAATTCVRHATATYVRVIGGVILAAAFAFIVFVCAVVVPPVRGLRFLEVDFFKPKRRRDGSLYRTPTWRAWLKWVLLDNGDWDDTVRRRRSTAPPTPAAPVSPATLAAAPPPPPPRPGADPDPLSDLEFPLPDDPAPILPDDAHHAAVNGDGAMGRAQAPAEAPDDQQTLQSSEEAAPGRVASEPGTFIRRYGSMFEEFSPRARWFMAAELWLSALLGVAFPLAVNDACIPVASAMCGVLYFPYLLALLLKRPHSAPANWLFALMMGFLQAVGAFLVIVGRAVDAEEGSRLRRSVESIAVCAMYLGLGKAVYDLALTGYRLLWRVVQKQARKLLWREHGVRSPEDGTRFTFEALALGLDDDNDGIPPDSGSDGGEGRTSAGQHLSEGNGSPTIGNGGRPSKLADLMSIDVGDFVVTSDGNGGVLPPPAVPIHGHEHGVIDFHSFDGALDFDGILPGGSPKAEGFVPEEETETPDGPMMNGNAFGFDLTGLDAEADGSLEDLDALLADREVALGKDGRQLLHEAGLQGNGVAANHSARHLSPYSGPHHEERSVGSYRHDSATAVSRRSTPRRRSSGAPAKDASRRHVGVPSWAAMEQDASSGCGDDGSRSAPHSSEGSDVDAAPPPAAVLLRAPRSSNPLHHLHNGPHHTAVGIDDERTPPPEPNSSSDHPLQDIIGGGAEELTAPPILIGDHSAAAVLDPALEALLSPAPEPRPDPTPIDLGEVFGIDTHVPMGNLEDLGLDQLLGATPPPDVDRVVSAAQGPTAALDDVLEDLLSPAPPPATPAPSQLPVDLL